MKKSVIVSVLAGVLALPGFVLAQETRIDKRQENQDERIEKGVRKGQLTKKEAERLEKGQDRIERLEDKAEADGKLTKKEKQRLEAAQDKQSEMIRKQRQDDQKRAN